jgi:uncharacterized protein YukE
VASDAVVNLIVNAADAESEVRAQLTRIVNDAERRAPTIDIRVDIDNASVVRALNRLDTQVDDNLRGINSTIGEGFADLSTQLSAQLDLLADHLSGIADNTDEISRAMRDLDRTGSNALGDVDRHARDADDSTNRLSGTFSRIGSSALGIGVAAGRIGLIASLASAALPAVVGLAGALANLAPAATAGVAAFATIKLATATLKIGLIGVSDALSQVFAAKPDAEALAESLERLSPHARAFVLELQKMRPALESIRTGTQDRIFDGLDTSLSRLSDEVLPHARTAAFAFADSFNVMASNAAKGATSISQQGVLGSALKSSTKAFSNLERIPGQVLVSIIRLANAGGPLLNKITSRIADAVTNISKNLATAQQSGALKTAVDNAVKAFKQIGRVASNVFGALGNIFATASAAGGGLFGSLEKITQALEDLTATQGFKDTLTALIETGQTLLSTVLPLLGQAFQAIAPVVEILAPPVQRLIELLGAQLSPIIELLGPIFELVATSVGLLFDALSPLIEAASTLIQAILPVLVPLFAALNEIIVALTPVIDVLVTSLVDAFLPVIEALVPIIAELADFIARVVVALAPLVEELVPLAVAWFTRWLPVITLILEALLPVISAILDFVAALVEHLVPAIQQGIEWVKQYAKEFEKVAGETFREIVLPALLAVAQFLNGDWSKAWEGAKTVAVRAGLQISASAVTFTGQLRTQIERAMSFAIRAFSSGFSSLVQATAGGIADIIGRFTSLPGQVRDILLGGLGGVLYDAGRAIIASFSSGMLSKLGEVASAAASVVGTVKDFFPNSPAKRGPFSGRGYTLYSGQAVVEDFARGLTSRTGLVTSAIASTLSAPLLATGPAGSTQNANALSGLAGNSFGRIAAPNVTVYLGNELLTDRMRTVVTDENNARDRQASQGVRF